MTYLHEDVRRYLKSEHKISVSRGSKFGKRRLEELVGNHARKIASDAMQGIFRGMNLGLKWSGPPFIIEHLSSFLGHKVKREKPPSSNEAELHPNPDSPGYYTIYCNPDQPLTRQNFAIAHELGHTIIPPYDFQIRKRERCDTIQDEAYQTLEKLCNIAASELLLPYAPFLEHLAQYEEVDVWAWEDLATTFDASREAVARRILSLGQRPMALVHFSLKHSSKEEREIPQLRLFGDGPEKKLRVDYACTSEGFDYHFPKNKSVPDKSPLIEVYNTKRSYSGPMDFDLKGMTRFHTEACFISGGTCEDHILALVWEG